MYVYKHIDGCSSHSLLILLVLVKSPELSIFEKLILRVTLKNLSNSVPLFGFPSHSLYRWLHLDNMATPAQRKIVQKLDSRTKKS